MYRTPGYVGPDFVPHTEGEGGGAPEHQSLAILCQSKAAA